MWHAWLSPGCLPPSAKQLFWLQMIHCCNLGPLGRQRTRCSKRLTHSPRTRPAGVVCPALRCMPITNHQVEEVWPCINPCDLMRLQGSCKVWTNFTQCQRRQQCTSTFWCPNLWSQQLFAWNQPLLSCLLYSETNVLLCIHTYIHIYIHIYIYIHTYIHPKAFTHTGPSGVLWYHNMVCFLWPVIAERSWHMLAPSWISSACHCHSNAG